MWYVVCMLFLQFWSKKLVCLWSMCIHTPALPFKSWNMRRNIMTTFFLVSSYPINDWKLWLICFNETSIMNCSLINHNNPVLRALPFIQATAEVILHNYSKFPVFERGLWKRPIDWHGRLPLDLPWVSCHQSAIVSSPWDVDKNVSIAIEVFCCWM